MTVWKVAEGCMIQYFEHVLTEAADAAKHLARGAGKRAPDRLVVGLGRVQQGSTHAPSHASAATTRERCYQQLALRNLLLSSCCKNTKTVVNLKRHKCTPRNATETHFRISCILGVSYCSLVRTLVYGLYRKCRIPGLWIIADWGTAVGKGVEV